MTSPLCYIMASNTSERDAVIVERLTQLYGAIEVMKKMVGTTSDSWAAESAQAIAGSDPDAPKTLYYNAAKNLYDVTTKCAFGQVQFCSFSLPTAPFASCSILICSLAYFTLELDSHVDLQGC